MKLGRFFLLGIGLVLPGPTFAQDLRPRFDDFFRDRPRRPTVEDDAPRTSAFDVGDNVRLLMGLELRNDIAQNLLGSETPEQGRDTGKFTHGYHAFAEWIGSRGLVSADLTGVLGTGVEYDNSTSPPTQLTPFVETIDASLRFRGRASADGWSPEYKFSVGYVGNEEIDVFLLSPREQQDTSHVKWGWGDRKNYQYGTVADITLKPGAGLTYQAESEESRWYAGLGGRVEAAIPTENSNSWKQSNVGLDGVVGFRLINGSSFAVPPILTWEVFEHSTLPIEGGTEVLLGTRLVGRFGFGAGTGAIASLEIFKPVETSDYIPAGNQRLDINGDRDLHFDFGVSLFF